MSKLITVLAPNGRRQNVKCSPNTTILQILEEVCQKQGFNVDEYDLRHHKTTLDPSNTLRFSGLPNNAFLDMIEVVKKRIQSNVVLGLQLENGDRRIGNFSPNVSLQEILTKLAPEESGSDKNPVVIFTRREVYGEDDLRKTTLKELGLTEGRAILRLIQRTPDQLKCQANVSSVLQPRPKPANGTSFIQMNTGGNMEVDAESNGSTIQREVLDTQQVPCCSKDFKNQLASEINAEPILNVIKSSKKELPNTQNQQEAEIIGKENFIPKNEKESNPLPSVSAIEAKLERRDNIEAEVKILGERQAIAFMQPEFNQAFLDDLDDDFYNLNVEDVKKLFRELQKQRAHLENAPLLTAELKNFENEKRILSLLHNHRHAVVRIQFPDRTVLQGIFVPTDTIESVKKFVKHFLEDPNVDFHLFVTPPKQTLDSSLSLLNANFVPCVLIHFGLDNISEPNKYLKQYIYQQLTAPDAATILASKYRNATGRKLDSSSSESSQDRYRSSNQASTSNDTQLPKWFKLK